MKMTRLQVSEFRNTLAEVGNRVAYNGERYEIERNNKPLFAVVPIEDAELLERLEDKMDLQLAAKAIKEGKFIDWDELKKELNL
jgi:prevent-host-death family protein